MVNFRDSPCINNACEIGWCDVLPILNIWNAVANKQFLQNFFELFFFYYGLWGDRENRLERFSMLAPSWRSCLTMINGKEWPKKIFFLVEIENNILIDLQKARFIKNVQKKVKYLSLLMIIFPKY